MGFLSSLTGSNIGKATTKAIGQNGVLLNNFQNAGNSIIDTGEQKSAGALDQAVSNYDPYLTAGKSATSMYSDALGLNGADGNAAATGAFQASPGYQFSLDQGTQAALRGASAAGMLNSGNTLTALSQYGTGLADQEYGSWLDRLNGLSGQGLTAANGAAGSLGNLASLYQGTADDRLGLESSVTQGQMGLNNDLAKVKEQQAQNSGSFLSKLVGGGLSLGCKGIDGRSFLMAIASLRVPISDLPTPDRSWLDSLTNSLGSAIDTAAQNKAFEQNVIPAITGTPAPQQQPGFLGRLFGGNRIPAPAAQQQVAATNPAPAQGSVALGSPNDIQNQFISTVRSGGLTNPYGLAAVAATGRAESSWDPSKVNAAWPDPSQSGAAGTAGGILSWRNERLANLRNFAQSQGEDPSNISPATQAKFFLQEDPTLIQRLNAAKSPQEAASIMANAWKFAGYDQAGGEAARRAALTQNYYSNQFANAQPPAAAPTGPTQVASLDPSIGMPMPGAAGEMRATNPAPTASGFDPATATPAQLNAALGPAPANSGYVDPVVTTAYRQSPPAAGSAPVNPPVQSAAAPAAVAPAASAGPDIIAAAQPATRQNVTNDQIAAMVRNPYTRQVGLQLWQQVLTGKTAQPWSFVKLDDGTLARANQSTGEVQSLGKFASSKKEILSNGKGAFYDTSTGQWIAPPEGMTGGTEYGLAPIYGTDANGNTVIGQLAKDGTFQQTKLPAGFVPTPGVSNTDLGTSVITRNNKTGQIIDTQRKDVQGEAFQKKVGTDTGEQAAGKVAAGSSLGSTLSSLDRLDAAANDLATDPDLSRVTGWSGLLPNVPGGKGASVQARLNTLKSQIGFSVLQAMRDASKTGGALGAISDKENELLQNNLASLSQAQSEGDLRTQLARIREYVAGAKARLSGAYRQMYGEDYQSPSAPAASSNTTSSGVKWSIEK